MSNVVLKVKNLSFAYGATEVLSGVSFVVNKGSYVALAGPNGAGKTTLIKLILGLDKPKTGEIEIFGTNKKDFKKWGRVGYLAQRASVVNPLFPASVKEVVGLGLLSQKKYFKNFSKSDKLKINEALKLMDISDFKDRLVSDLSGGQQQRVFLARALVSNPELLVLDEPSTALDPQIRENFFTLINNLNKEKGITIILVTHDTAQVGLYANELLYLDKTVIFYGPFADFCHSENMEKYFGHFAQHLICHQHD